MEQEKDGEKSEGVLDERKERKQDKRGRTVGRR